MKVALYPNFQKKNALECAKRVCGILKEIGFQVAVTRQFEAEFPGGVIFEEIEVSAHSSEFVIAIGGDGTMLRCAKNLVGYDTKLLGINTGRLGFMASLESDELEKLVNLRTEDYSVSERMLLRGVLTGGETAEFCALNDIAIHSGLSKAGDFAVYSGVSHIGTYRADGVLFSTPTGSTAYALSAGGPIIEPDLECIEMTLMCPHTFFSRPMIFQPERLLRVENVSPDDRKDRMYLSVDGDPPIHFGPDAKLEIRKSSHKIKLVDIGGNTFHESVGSKLMRSIK